jgi:hypothetical protein
VVWNEYWALLCAVPSIGLWHMTSLRHPRSYYAVCLNKNDEVKKCERKQSWSIILRQHFSIFAWNWGEPGEPRWEEPLSKLSVLACLYVPVSTNVRLFRVGWVQRNQFKIPTSPVLVLSRYVHCSLAFAIIFRHVSQAVGTLVSPSGALTPKLAACCHWEVSTV